MFLLSYPVMYFITESAAIECGCILGGIVSYIIWCCMTLFKECLYVSTDIYMDNQKITWQFGH